MATCYPSSSNQRDAPPIIYSRQPLPGSYAEALVIPTNMMMYASYPSSFSAYTAALPGNSKEQNTYIDVPLAQPPQEIIPNLTVSRGLEHDCNAWRDGRNEELLMHTMAASGPAGIVNGSSQFLQGQNQGLSLSLGMSIPSGLQMSSGFQYQSPNSAYSFLSHHGSDGSFPDDESSLNNRSVNVDYFPTCVPQDLTKLEPSLYEMSNVVRTIPNSNYLKAAQQLLDEVVNGQKGLRPPQAEKKPNSDALRIKNGMTSPPSNPLDSGNSPSELSSAVRHELQNMLTKLLSMLDEVDRKYKQYYHQMQMVISSFDAVAGYGAAKSYTALPLKTISRHFRCLHDAITGQIQVTRKSFGEQDTSTNSKGVGISRLRYVDQQLRQDRTLQQLGVMHQHTWRPQRGLPESSVSILRAWLFEHFLHPYPKDSDKIMLATQTGLTRSQVSNWFINARVRLWKPMVEDMYKEEIGDAEKGSNSSSENASMATKGNLTASEDVLQSATSTAATTTYRSSTDRIPHSEILGSIAADAFRNGTQGETEADQRDNMDDDYGLYPDGIVQYGGQSLMAAANAYQMAEIGGLENGGSGISLTLGLQPQHSDGAGLPMRGGTHHTTVTMREGSKMADFDCMDSGNQQQPRYISIFPSIA